MYEMYPDTWAQPEPAQPSAAQAKPKRRARRPHSVLPAVLAHLTPSVRTGQAEPSRG